MLIEKLIPSLNVNFLSLVVHLSTLPLLTAPQTKALPHRNAKRIEPQLKCQTSSNRTVIRHK